jgi:hypothetical protein
MYNIPTDLIDLEKCPIPIFDILENIREFYLTLDISYGVNNAPERAIQSRLILMKTLALIRNLFKPEENNYIKDYQKQFELMVDNFGRADRFIDEFEKKVEEVENAKGIVSIHPRELNKSSKITQFTKRLEEYMNTGVYIPLKYAYIKYKKQIYKEGQLIKKTPELFIYFLFLEMLRASEMLGTFSREKSQKTWQYHDMPSYPPNATFEEPEEKYELNLPGILDNETF